ncbi:hypothetical protein ACF08M_37475 [Streptomyces sp. NPDC015032]|uniref:hypothetical protein n=1 Tax=Streptomyces sp. NPDC015032 TaxID=3364937 RepID=UPI0036F90030
MPRFMEEVRELLAGLPGNLLDRTYGRELRGETDDPDYWTAQEEYLRACVVRTAPVRLDSELMSPLTFRTLVGQADYHVTGTLKDWEIFDELERIRIPTLVLGGEFDKCLPSHLADIAARIPDSARSPERPTWDIWKKNRSAARTSASSGPTWRGSRPVMPVIPHALAGREPLA